MTKFLADHENIFERAGAALAPLSRRRGYLKIFKPTTSLRKRVAISLAIVRIILVPVIFLAVYYLFQMGWIVDRIVNTDAPAASLAEQASIEMLEARRAERNYFLLRDDTSVEKNHEAIAKVSQTLQKIREVQPEENDSTTMALNDLLLYQERFAAAVTAVSQPGMAPADRIQTVVRAYEKDLNSLLKGDRYNRRELLIEELRRRVGSFDAQITDSVQAGNPALEKISADLQDSSQSLLTASAAMETRNWDRVQRDHQQARHLIRQAEWALGSVSFLTFLFSVLVSFILPRQVVKPLVRLKEAVDRVAENKEGTELEIGGAGEITQLAESIQHLILRLRHSV
jgi:CHASE3 domain sensor protein